MRNNLKKYQLHFVWLLAVPFLLGCPSRVAEPDVADGEQSANVDDPIVDEYAAEEMASPSQPAKKLAVPADWPEDVPLPRGNVREAHTYAHGRDISLDVTESSFDDLINLYAEMEDQGWVPLAANSNGKKNDRLAQFTYNNGPRQVGVSIVKEDAEPSVILVHVTIGKNPRYKPED